MDPIAILPALRWLSLGLGPGLTLGYGLAWLLVFRSSTGPDHD